MQKLLAILCLFPLLSHATNYYISSSAGNDGNNGMSSSTPWKTLSAHRGIPVAGDTMFLKSGDVFNEPLYITKSGTISSHIVWSTYGGAARAVINGFTTLAGGTRMGTSDIYEFYCPGLTAKTNMLVMDGIPQPMGRWPDTGYRTYTACTLNSITDAGLSSSPYNWTGATLANHSEFYIIDTAVIAGQTTNTITTVTNFHVANPNRGNGYFVENDARTLLLTTIPGRWYNKYTVDSMQVYLPGGLGSHVLKVPTLDTLCNANFGTQYNDVYNIDLEGSNLATLLINHNWGHTFTNCLFRYGGNDCWLGNECPFTKFVNDTLDYFQNNGAKVTGSTSTNCLVQNVLVNHCGMIPGMGQDDGDGNKSYTGWDHPMGSNIFQNMTILNSGYSGLCFGGDSTFATNVVVDTFCATKIDGGGFYTADGSFVTYTYGRKLTSCMALHGQGSHAGVKWDSTDAAMGFYCDSHSSSVTLTNCTGALNSTAGIYVHGSKITTRNNNFYGNGWCQRCLVEFSGIPLTGVSMKYDQLANNAPGQLCNAFVTPANDLNSFGVVDSNYYANTSTAAFYTKSSADGGTTRTLSSWQSNTGYDLHSTFLNIPAAFYYNTTGVATAPATHFRDLASAFYSGVIPVGAFSSLIVYLVIP
ncbi:MAG TPA: hypothetical protein VHD83_23160 [Puia sp.]|nr:hypothetical protein [Puia sp.]